MTPETTLLLGVGAQKAGTSWLAQFFQKHPEVYLPAMKELHVLDVWHLPHLSERFRSEARPGLKRAIGQTGLLGSARAIREHWRRQAILDGGIEDYLGFFARFGGSHPVAADFTPAYSMLNAAQFAQVKGAHPKTKALFLMRDPIERAWSAMRFRERIGTAPDGPGLDTEDGFLAELESEELARRSDYAATVTALDNVFGPDDVHYVFYEQLFDQAEVDRICNWLGIACRAADLASIVNPTKRTPLPLQRRQRMAQKLGDVYGFCRHRFGSVPEAWEQSLEMAGL